jgi:hypothetical protein
MGITTEKKGLFCALLHYDDFERTNRIHFPAFQDFALAFPVRVIQKYGVFST